jgi:hypothetical protein
MMKYITVMRTPSSSLIDKAVRAERRRIVRAIRDIRMVWLARVDKWHGRKFSGAVRAVDALDAALTAARAKRK